MIAIACRDSGTRCSLRILVCSAGIVQIAASSPNEEQIGQDTRIILASANFSRELTTTVLWLRDRNLDIRCVRLQPYRLADSRVLLDVQQLIPLPETASFQTRIGVKRQAERRERTERYDQRIRFWSELVARPDATHHGHITPGIYSWIGTSAGVRGIGLNLSVRKQDCQAEIYIDRGKGADEENLAIFDQLLSRREAIETAFGGELRWQRLENSRACRIAAPCQGGWQSSEEDWEHNPILRGRDIRGAFNDEECKLLLVANKFQTGFDQPLLCGMYVDRRLAGIQAVQTLSRLNRAYPGKETTYILDFVNSSEEVLAAFRQYYETAEIEAETDPNLIFDLRQKLDASGHYDQFEIDRLVAVELDPNATQGRLIAAIEPVAQRILTQYREAQNRYKDATKANDKTAATAAREEMDVLLQVRGDMAGFTRIYAFLSQIFDYGSTEIEKRYMLFKRLIPLLQFGRERDGVDLSGVRLTHHTLKIEGARTLQLGDERPALPPITGVGSGAVQEKEKALLAEIIAKVNDLFDGDLTDDDQLVYVNNVIKGKLLESEELRSQARNNSKAQFASSPTLSNAILDAIIDAMAAHETMSSQALNSAKVREGLRDVLLGSGQLYEGLRNGIEKN